MFTTYMSLLALLIDSGMWLLLGLVFVCESTVSLYERVDKYCFVLRLCCIYTYIYIYIDSTIYAYFNMIYFIYIYIYILFLFLSVSMFPVCSIEHLCRSIISCSDLNFRTTLAAICYICVWIFICAIQFATVLNGLCSRVCISGHRNGLLWFKKGPIATFQTKERMITSLSFISTIYSNSD